MTIHALEEIPCYHAGTVDLRRNVALVTCSRRCAMSITPLIARPDRPRRPSQRVLDYDASQSTFSTPGRQALRLGALPCDPAGVMDPHSDLLDLRSYPQSQTRVARVRAEHLREVV